MWWGPKRAGYGQRSPILIYLSGAATGLLAFVLYLRTLAPTVLYYDLPDLRDSATLQAKAFVLGIPDYTGYPTWVMLGKLFTYLPFGDAAYRVNLSSAVYAALAVALVYAIGAVLTGRAVPAAAGALAFAVGPLFWSQAVVAEVYTLNALFISLVIFVLLLWRRSGRDRWLLVASFLCGLSLTHHLTSGLLVVAGLLFVFLVDRAKLRDLGLLLKGVGLFLLGLLPYAYLPIRASMDYLPNGWVWGQPLIREYPPNTPYGFYNLVSGGLWKERMWAFGVEELPGRFALYLHYLYGEAGQFGVALLLVAWGGFLYLAFRDRVAAVLLGFLFLGWLFHALEYNIEDIYYYFIPTYLILAVFVAAGFDGLLTAARNLAEGAPPWARAAVLAVISVAALAFPLLGVGETYREVDRSGDYHGREIVEAVAEKADPGATILHHRSPLDFMILAEGRREDVRLIPYLEDPEPPAVERAREALEGGPVYVLFPGRETTPYYPGVEDSRKLYEAEGMNLVEVDSGALLYEVVPRDGAA
jgi:4-amino-4-deoxy-L-arabinose transferase-like glycosyltransferase